MSGDVARSPPPPSVKRRLSVETVREVVTEKAEKERKLSLSSLDEEYSPSVDEYIGGSVDDESSIQYEEDEEDGEEIEELKKEGELPIEDLIVRYGLKGDQYAKFKEDSQDSDTDAESVTHGVRMSMYDKDDWKKEISIGPEFQAEIPPLQDKAKLAEEEERGTLLWRPDRLNSEELHQYLSTIYSKEELPIVDFHRDDEQALYNLHTHDYKIDTAMLVVEDRKHWLNSSMKPWSKEECQNFEAGLKQFGKQFHLVHKNNVPSRSISEIVQFYYLWKKTERYDIFIRYSKIGSKRYIFNPGLSLDFERSNYSAVEGGEGREEEEEEDEEEDGEGMAANHCITEGTWPEP